MNTVAATPPPALLLVADHRLRDEVRRIAAAADRHLDAPPLPPARAAWASAGLVILDTVAARECLAAGLPRRGGTVVVAQGEPGLSEWQVAAAIGTDRVLTLPAAADRLIELCAEPDRRGPGDGAVVAIVGATGGAGASTLAAAVALTAVGRFERETLLVDGDPFGGGIDLLLGLESEPGLRWPDLAVDDGRVPSATLHDALPSPMPGLGVLACGRTGEAAAPEPAPGAVRAVLSAGRTAGDLVVCDVSGARGPHADQMVDGADLVVLVVPARLRAVAAARAVVAALHPRNPNQALIVRGPAPGGLRGGDVSRVLGLPLLAAVRAQPGLAGRLERSGLGPPRGPLRVAAEAVVRVLSGIAR
jgi:secretion/DNA translocation related CpaE-like protein